MARRHKGLYGECDFCAGEADLDYCKICAEAYCEDCTKQHDDTHVDYGDDED